MFDFDLLYIHLHVISDKLVAPQQWQTIKCKNTTLKRNGREYQQVIQTHLYVYIRIHVYIKDNNHIYLICSEIRLFDSE